MSEIALRTSERLATKGNVWHWRPVGSTIICCTDSLIRRKWLEICCYLVSPKKRDTYRALPGWDKLCEAWTPELREAWLEFDRPTETNRLSPLLEDEAFLNSVWQTMIEPIGVLDDLHFAPESDRKVYDTWLWSEFERKNYFIIVNEDTDSETVQGWQGVEERDADSGDVLSPLLPGTVRDPAINVALVWNKQIDYKTDIGLSGSTLTDIADPSKTLNPRHDKPVSQIKVQQPSIAGMKAVA